MILNGLETELGDENESRIMSISTTKLDRPQDRRHLEDLINEYKIKVIIIDPLKGFHHMREDKADFMSNLLRDTLKPFAEN